MTPLINPLLAEVRDCLSELIDSAFLDATELGRDCLEVFDTYAWEPKSDLNEEDSMRWSELLNKGNNGDLGGEELSEFLELTSHEGQTHSYYYRIRARKLVDAIQEHEKESTFKAVSIEKASKSAAATCMFDLESEELNADIIGVLSPDLIFDAVQLFSSLTINIDNIEYELKPYWPYLSEDNALEILEDMRTAIESELTRQYKTFTDCCENSKSDKLQLDFSLKDECASKLKEEMGEAVMANTITEEGLDNAVYAVKESLECMGIKLDSDELLILNDKLESFLLNDIGVEIES
ncbi:TPA: hypothetical protein RQK91_004217 [Vibrio vulnificus]|nr:hypothetical protein [Vibrio vulnificus]